MLQRYNTIEEVNLNVNIKVINTIGGISCNDMSYAFEGCTSLTRDEIIEAENIETIMDAFFDTLLPITVKATEDTTTWNSLLDMEIPENITIEPYE